jgi:hypothetical protein
MKTMMCALVLGAGVIACDSATHDTASSEFRDRFIQTTTGTVESYTPGESIVLKSSDGGDQSMALDAGARVDDSLAAGQTVTVAWLTDSLGRRRVTSIAPFSPGSAEAAAGGSASSAPPSKAYASADEGTAMSTTPAGSMVPTPGATRPGGEYTTPLARDITGTPGPLTTPGPPVRTPPGGAELR